MNKVVPIIAIPETGLRCHVRILDEFLRRLLNNFCVKPRSIWFTANPIGKNTHSKINLKICQEENIGGRKSNHSLRATGVSDLFRAGVPEKLIQKRSEHMSINGLCWYQSYYPWPGRSSVEIAHILFNLQPVAFSSADLSCTTATCSCSPDEFFWL